MRYLSVCSGIEAATVAWHPLGWQPFAFAEIEKFPRAVLAHHYPSVPNLGDMTKFKDWPDAIVDVLVGGTPCQSFSVAGLRKGLADPRGNLALTYLAIADRYQPTWLVWENVPGVLSSGEGRDFGAFLGGLGELGYGFAYRVLDAQYVRVDGFARAVPQRRRRVFVVGHLGDWRRAAAVLFERESLFWHSAPRRQAGERASVAARCGFASSGDGFWRDGIGPLRVRAQDSHENLITSTGDVAHCLNAGGMGRQDYETETMVAHALRAEGSDASEEGTGHCMPLVPVAFDTYNQTVSGDGTTQTLCSRGDTPGGNAHLVPAVAFAENQRGELVTSDVIGALKVGGGKPRQGYPAIAQSWAVRRLTPRECERLQGFPDDYTAIPKAADGPRYKALGNSMAVNVMRWIGQRIAKVSISPHERQHKES